MQSTKVKVADVDLELLDTGQGARPVLFLHGGGGFAPQQPFVTPLSESREVQDDSGRWFSVAVRPYRTTDNRIDGAVVVYIDIDPMKRNLKLAEEARDYAEGMIETVREPLLVLDSYLRIQRATSNFYQTFQVSRGETLGRLL